MAFLSSETFIIRNIFQWIEQWQGTFQNINTAVIFLTEGKLMLIVCVLRLILCW